MGVGLALYVGASVLSVVEEWPKQGLTDTSYKSLALWMVGSLVLAGGAIVAGYLLMLTVCLTSLLATSIGLVLKLKDRSVYRRHRDPTAYRGPR